MGSLHGYEIESDRGVRRLSQARGELGSIRVMAADSSPLQASAELLHLILASDGGPNFTLARVGPRLVCWSADAGSFSLEPETLTIRYRRDDANRPLSELRWDDRLGSTIVPLLAGTLGGFALHASANLVAGGALLTCGVTGRGKSTLAAALAAAGHPLVSEDGVVVRRPGGRAEVWPGLTGALVTGRVAEMIGARPPAGGSGDHRGRSLVPVPAAAGPVPVAAVAILAERGGSKVRVERLSPARAHRELLAQVLSGLRAGRDSFSGTARLAERVPVALARVPNRLEDVPQAASALAALVGNGLS